MAEISMQYAKIKEDSLNISERDKKIYSFIENNDCNDYDDIIPKEIDYYTFCQLSELRKGLISWYPFKAHAKVLEIGAGFGAITGCLCEKCETVVATERSSYRGNAIALRHKQHSNLSIYVGDVLDMTFDTKFDYIMLNGLLERIAGGNQELLAYSKYLDLLQRFLKDDGRILFAVDNRMGLKYFCGGAEMHTKRPFDGISNYKRGTSGRSFTKKEVEDIIENSVFDKYRFYYPLPDYKIPQLIYTDAYLPQNNLKERLIPYDPFEKSYVLNELDLYKDIIENKVFPFFSNSFFVECGRKEILEEVLYAAISTDRGRKRSFATAVCKDEQGNMLVRKQPLYDEGKENAKKLYEHIMDLQKHGVPVVNHTYMSNNTIEMPYIKYPTLSNYIKEIISKDKKAFTDLIKQLYEYILKSSEIVDDSKNQMAIVNDDGKKLELGPILKKAYIELIPLNCFYNDEKKAFLFFDQEFMRENYPAKYILFRAIHYIYCFTPNANDFYSLEQLKEEYGLSDLWTSFLEEENRFLVEVRNHDRYRQFYKWADISQERIESNIDRLINHNANPDKEACHVSEQMKKVWNVQLEILDCINTICEKYQLRYFLVHGSLLGAVRHKGFIPWDDDLDIAMLREDYDCFIKVAEKEFKPPLSLHNFYTDQDMFWGGYSRVRNERTTAIETRNLNQSGNQGIWVDILPLDICTMNEQKLKKKEKKIRHYHRLIYAKIYGKQYLQFGDMNCIQWKLYKLAAGFISHNKLAVKLDAAMRLFTDETSENIASFGGYYKHRPLSINDFKDVDYLTFENRKVPVPIGYENYLFMTLGKDYMKYPPREERKPKHRGIYDAENAYTVYKNIFCDMFSDIKGKTLILFGAGQMFEDYMNKYGDKYRPAFLVDNDQNKWGRQRMGIDIKKPEDILDIPVNKRKVIICSYYYKEITKQLEEMGVTDYKIYIQNMEWILRTEEQK